MTRLAWQAVVLLAAVGALFAQSPSADLRVVLTGDSIINRRLSVYDEPDYLQLIGHVRAADAAFTNLETLIHNFEYPAAAVSGGAWMGSPRWVLKELEWAGFDLLSIANNHTMDYGIEGLRSTIGVLEASRLVYAGAGETLARARAPAYFDTNKGRIALIACSSTFSASSPAGAQRPDHIGRPGLNPLRVVTTYYLDPPALNSLRKLTGASSNARDAAGFRFLGVRFKPAEKPRVETIPHENDMKAILASVREARRQPDWVIVSIHAHQGMAGHRELPAQFLVQFAHEAIEEGADIIAGHGPHVLRAIEIYKGKPIFYSLANFIFENETMRFQPAESYNALGLLPSASVADFYDARTSDGKRGFPANELNWRSAVAEVVFSADHTLRQVRLLPITLGFGESRTSRGRPRLATGALTGQIFESLSYLSGLRGTEICSDGSVGSIKLDGAPGSQR